MLAKCQVTVGEGVRKIYIENLILKTEHLSQKLNN